MLSLDTGTTGLSIGLPRPSAPYDRVEYASPAVFVLGGEGKGLHEQVRKHCDVLVRIPLAGKISSLNVSVAAGIVLFDWKRRRDRQNMRKNHEPPMNADERR